MHARTLNEAEVEGSSNELARLHTVDEVSLLTGQCMPAKLRVRARGRKTGNAKGWRKLEDFYEHNYLEVM